jgi:hypothetical protein
MRLITAHEIAVTKVVDTRFDNDGRSDSARAAVLGSSGL